jgi:hypothetical protein
MDTELLTAILQEQGLTPAEIEAYLNVVLGDAGFGNPFGGVVTPWSGAEDVDDANDIVDFNRDVFSLGEDQIDWMADPVVGALAGLPGIGGSAASVAIDQFRPVETIEYIDGPDTMMLQNFKNMPEGTLPRWLYEQMVVDKRTVPEVQAFVDSMVTGDDPDDPGELALKRMLEGAVKPYVNERGRTVGIDTTEITDLAEQLQAQTYATPPAGAQQDEFGRWYTVKSEPSEAMQKYDELNLPYPTLQYELADFSPDAAALAERRATLSDARQAADEKVSSTRSAYDRLLEQLPQRQEVWKGQDLYDRQRAEASESEATRERRNELLRGQLPTVAEDWRWLGSAAAEPPSHLSGGSDMPPTDEGLRRPVNWKSEGIPNTRWRPQAPERDPMANAGVYERGMSDWRSKLRDARVDWAANLADQERQRRELYNSEMEARGRYNRTIPGDRERVEAQMQGSRDYGTAIAQGRTPLSDALRNRAMAMMLLGRY